VSQTVTDRLPDGQTLVTKGGPHLVGQFEGAGLLDEVFLTLSPVPARRDEKAKIVTRLGAGVGPQQ